MIKIIKSYVEGIKENNTKYCITFLVTFFIFVVLVFCGLYAKFNVFGNVISFDKENCKRIETDINNIVKDTEDINLIDVDELKKRSLNVQRIFDNDGNVKKIYLTYDKDKINGEIYQKDGNIQISVKRDKISYVWELLVLVLTPIFVYVMLLFILVVVEMAAYG